ncbi:hypothetical protein BT69DRAFT_238510 [Atractiella rhizophila]|nr:hypothetical protein BT69DRAFT_238510 [Atractiella rhizophila]
MPGAASLRPVLPHLSVASPSPPSLTASPTSSSSPIPSASPAHSATPYTPVQHPNATKIPTTARLYDVLPSAVARDAPQDDNLIPDFDHSHTDASDGDLDSSAGGDHDGKKRGRSSQKMHSIEQATLGYYEGLAVPESRKRRGSGGSVTHEKTILPSPSGISISNVCPLTRPLLFYRLRRPVRTRFIPTSRLNR